MIDFDSIPKRVCSDSKLREAFLRDPLGFTEELLAGSDVLWLLSLDADPNIAHEDETSASLPASAQDPLGTNRTNS